MRALKCPACGASLKSETECPYCGMVFKVEAKAEKNNVQPTPVIPVQQQQTYQPPRNIPRRPSVNVLTFVLCVIIAWPAALVYWVIVAGKQKEWEDKYRRH